MTSDPHPLTSSYLHATLRQALGTRHDGAWGSYWRRYITIRCRAIIAVLREQMKEPGE
jgi:hypothetical protein